MEGRREDRWRGQERKRGEGGRGESTFTRNKFLNTAFNLRAHGETFPSSQDALSAKLHLVFNWMASCWMLFF